jgi:N utilization substance protein A
MASNNQPRTEFNQALKAIAMERGLDPNVILEAIEQAIIAAFRRDAKEAGTEYPEETVITAQIDSLDGGAKVFIDGKDVTPPGFGRIAAQTAKQVIHQKIREAERGSVMEEYMGKVGSLVSGIVLRFDGSNVKVDLGRTEGIMPAEERIPQERLTQGQRLTFLLKDIKETIKGKEIILSRADPQFVVKLFAREVPEINSGSVEIKLISREAGVRTKIAVFSSQSGVDPVGSCVGQKGVRVQAVTNELGGERVDVIPYTEDVAELVKLALGPAENLEVKVVKKDKTASVKAPEDQLSLAIGKDGQNVRLASKLVGYKIEIVGDGSIIEDKTIEEKTGVEEVVVEDTK